MELRTDLVGSSLCECGNQQHRQRKHRIVSQLLLLASAQQYPTRNDLSVGRGGCVVERVARSEI